MKILKDCGERFIMVALFGTIVMSETTVEVDGTEVVVRETSDGYEAEEIDNSTYMLFESGSTGSVIAIDMSQPHEVAVDPEERGIGDNVIAYNESQRLESESEYTGNNSMYHHLFDGDWDYTWKFDDCYPLE